MTTERRDIVSVWRSVRTDFLPFADAASDALPMSRLLRLSLFQVSVGMAVVLLTGTLNRVMIVELSVPAWIVSLMVSLPLVFAPLRALIGHRSDHHRSVLGWRRGPYIWFGSLLQFGGLAIMPFALLILAGFGTGHVWLGYVAGALAFLMTGAGMHTVQTAGLALATDIAPAETRPRVVALLYVMLLAGMAISALIYGLLLTQFSQIRLIQLVQGAAFITVALNFAALWKQESRIPFDNARSEPRPDFKDSWRAFTSQPRVPRLLAATGLGAAAFAMQDILLEPYGGEVLSMSVSATTTLTAVFSIGSIIGFALPAKLLASDGEPHRIAGLGALVGIIGFTAVILSSTIQFSPLFVAGVSLIGLGGGLFSVCTLIAVMSLAETRNSGMALGAWGAVHATATGTAIAIGGAMRDGVTLLSSSGALGPALTGPGAGYSTVYSTEVILLFCVLVVIGPLAKHAPSPTSRKTERLEIHAFPN